jgi:CheY-like chemotaxis protein
MVNDNVASNWRGEVAASSLKATIGPWRLSGGEREPALQFQTAATAVFPPENGDGSRRETGSDIGLVRDAVENSGRAFRGVAATSTPSGLSQRAAEAIARNRFRQRAFIHFRTMAALTAGGGRASASDIQIGPPNAEIAAMEEAQAVNLPLDDAQTTEGSPHGGIRRRRRVLDVLVVEDESIIAKDIEFIVTDLGHRAVGPARTHEEAVSLASKARPGVIVADVKLADGSSGIVAVDEILKSVDAAVVFVTAVPHWLQTGETEPFFVVPKPYSVAAIKAAVARATSKRAQTLEAIRATKSAVGRLTRKQ